jgi:hypothetical protein
MGYRIVIATKILSSFPLILAFAFLFSEQGWAQSGSITNTTYGNTTYSPSNTTYSPYNTYSSGEGTIYNTTNSAGSGQIVNLATGQAENLGYPYSNGYYGNGYYYGNGFPNPSPWVPLQGGYQEGEFQGQLSPPQWAVMQACLSNYGLSMPQPGMPFQNYGSQGWAVIQACRQQALNSATGMMNTVSLSPTQQTPFWQCLNQQGANNIGFQGSMVETMQNCQQRLGWAH